MVDSERINLGDKSMIEWAKAANAAYNIISLLLNDEITTGKRSVIKHIRDRIHSRKVKKYCRIYFRMHNGTVLTNPVFNEWLKNDRTINRLFAHTEEIHPKLTDEEYVVSELDRIKKYMEYPINGSDLAAIRGFLEGLLIEHRKYREKWLSEDTKQIIQNEDRNTKYIINNIGSLPEQIGQEFLSVIESKGSLSSIQENTMFKVLNRCFFEGRFEILENILPILQEKSKNLEIWLSSILQMALINGDDYRIYQSINEITHPNIKEDAVRKTILFSYLNNKNIYAEDFNVSGELRELLVKIQEDDSWLFIEKKEINDNVECYYLYPFSGMKSESDTIKKLQVICVFNMGTYGVSAVINSIKDNKSTDFIIDLMSRVRQYNELLVVCESEVRAKELSSTIFDELWSKKDIYIKTSKKIQVLFWETILRACAIFNKIRISEIIESIPQCIDDEMQESVLLARINSGETISSAEIVDFWKQRKNHKIMGAFLARCDAEYASEIIRDIPDLMKEPEIVLIYCECFIREKRIDEAGKLLEIHSEICADYAEYFVDRVEVFHKEEDVNYIAECWMSHAFKYINNQTDEIIANIFYSWKRYELCLLVLRSLELKGYRGVYLSKLKAFSLINTEKVVEGLSVLNEIVPQCMDDISVIGNVLNCSLSLQREVSAEVVNAAEKMDSSDIKMFLAVFYERKGDIHEAKKNYWKAIIYNKNNESKVYGAYWFFSINHYKGTIETDISDVDTCIIADELNGNRRIVIGVLTKEYVQGELTIDGIHLVSTDTAVKKGWLGKKIDAIIEYDDSSYHITKIESMEACFSEICLEKVINSGSVNVLSIPQNSAPDQMSDYFVKFLQANSPDNSAAKDAFDDYKDLSKLPLSLFALSHFLRSNYVVSVYSILKDPSLITREWIEYENDAIYSNKQGYVLSFSALIILFLLQIPAEKLIENKVYLPKSTLLELRNEKDEVITENKRVGSGTISVVDNQLHFFANSEESKQELMRYVTELLEYAEKLPTIENEKDFSIDNISESQIRCLLGTPDLDAISICRTKQYTLITFELFLTDFNLLAHNASISPLTFINSIESEDGKLIEYLYGLLNLHMMNVLDVEVYKRVANSENEKVLELWSDYIEKIDKQDTIYKNWLKEHFARVNQKYLIGRTKEQPVNEFERIFSVEVMKLLEREVHYSTDTLHDKDGNIVIRTYLRVFDKVQQKYIEELDQIVDRIFRIELTPSAEENPDYETY